MARGDVTIFDEFVLDLGKKVHDLPNDDLAVALVDDTITPTAADTSPTWSDYSANEVSGSGYTAGGESIGTITWTVGSGVVELAGDDVGWSITVGGPTDCRWGIIVNKDAASDQCIGFVDLGGTVSLEADDIDIEWNGGIIYRHTANATPA